MIVQTTSCKIQLHNCVSVHAPINSIDVQCSKWDGMKRYAIPAPLLASWKHIRVFLQVISWGGGGKWEWFLYPYRHLLFPTSTSVNVPWKLNLMTFNETAVISECIFHYITGPELYGHLVPPTPLLQHWHETKVSGDAPINGWSDLIINPHCSTETSLWPYDCLYYVKAACSWAIPYSVAAVLKAISMG